MIVNIIFGKLEMITWESHSKVVRSTYIMRSILVWHKLVVSQCWQVGNGNMGIIPNSCQEHVNDSRSINTEMIRVRQQLRSTGVVVAANRSCW